MGIFTRLEIFHSYKDHPWLARSYNKLSVSERNIAINFLIEKNHLCKEGFEKATVRMFLDKESKPKHWREIEELLVCANSKLEATK